MSTSFARRKFLRHIFIVVAIFLTTTILPSCAKEKKPKNQKFNFKIERSHVYLPVSIEDETYFFLLDTGAGSCSINRKIFEKKKFSIVGKAKFAGAQRIWKEANIIEVADLKIANLSFRKMKCLVTDSKIEGIIGMDIFLKNSILLNFKEKTFTFYPKIKKLRYQIPYSIKNKDDILVTVNINGKNVPNFIFDTGGSTNLSYRMVDELELSRHPGKEIRPGVFAIEEVISVDSTGNKEVTYYYVADSFCFGPICRNNQKLMSVKYHEKEKSYQRNGMIGLDFFEASRMLLDLPNGKIFFE